jgi:hypothetical protein
MKQEETNQGVRDGNFVKVASKKARETILKRIARIVDGRAYVVLDDFVRELGEIKGILLRMRAPERRYSVALLAETAECIFLELLLIPRAQKSHTSPEPETSAEASHEMTHAANEAMQISQALWLTPDANPTYEDLQREINKASNPELTRQLLLSAHSSDDSVTAATGNELPAIPAAPRYIASGSSQQVALKIKWVDEDAGQATVTIRGAKDPDALCLHGLFDRRVRLVFDETALPGFGKLLVLAQAAEVDIQLQANVQRGLGPGSARHDQLLANEVVDEVVTRAIISEKMKPMMTVNAELPFEET